jgi:MinD-like ATPase involved in chromosome partitioning or flagellar assembly
MPDDEPPTPEELEGQRRASAQDAAGDLARMGIDPRLLGLDTPTPQRPHPRAGDEATDDVAATSVPSAQSERPAAGPDPAPVRARIVPLRPEFAPGVTTSTAPEWPRQGTTSPAYGPVEQLLARAAAQRPPPARSRRWIKAVTFGLLTPDAAESATNERLFVAAVRTRQSDRRVVTFTAGKGGVGTTTIALGVGTALAALREDHTVLVDAQAGTAAVSALLGVAAAPTARDLSRPGFDAPPAVAAGGLRLVDSSGWETPLRRPDVPGLLDRLKADHAFVLVDLGNDAGEAGQALLARSDQLVIVTGPGSGGLAAAQVAAERLRRLDPHGAARALHVIVCTHQESYRRVRKELAQQPAGSSMRVVVVPPDGFLALGQPFDPASLRPATREAMLEVAAAVAVSGGVMR